jgi:TolB protein
MNFLTVWYRSCLLFLLLAHSPAHAVLTIHITQGAEGALPIAIVPFAWQTNMGDNTPLDIAAVVDNDLQRSGRFAPLARMSMPSQVQSPEIDFTPWQSTGALNLVVGQLSSTGADSYTVEFHLFDVLKGEKLLAYRFSSSKKGLRSIAHQISDMIYQTLLGEGGAFNSQLAYVSIQGRGANKSYQLIISDIDGAQEQVILTSDEPLLSPAWSPDGQQLAYVSFEHKRTSVWVQNVTTGQRHQVAAWKGMNTAPAWSPDGHHLALSLSQSGDPEIYVLNIHSRQLNRITNNPAIDTEPSWSPDGQQLVFTSDRGGQPQIYRVSAQGGQAQRVTFEGGYNASASYSPNGKELVFLNGNQGMYRIAVMNLENGQMRLLSQTSLDESPAFAPNGSMVIYAANTELAIVSVDGRIRQRVAVGSGTEIREPAWSSLRNY